MKKSNNCYVTQHSCFLLQYHLVLVTKYRYPVIVDNIKDFLINFAKSYFNERDLNILEVNTDKDHIHIMFEAYPNLNLANLVGNFKSVSSRNANSKFEDILSKYYRTPHFWSDSYFICTVSERSTALVKEYIKNQGSKRKR